MKSKLIILSVVMLMFSASQVFAEEEYDRGEMADDKGSMMENKGSMMEEHHSELLNVGNKICPISGRSVDVMGDPIQVEYNGKQYNLCCKMCAKDFKKNPEKFSKIMEEEVAGAEHEESGHDQ